MEMAALVLCVCVLILIVSGVVFRRHLLLISKYRSLEIKNTDLSERLKRAYAAPSGTREVNTKGYVPEWDLKGKVTSLMMSDSFDECMREWDLDDPRMVKKIDVTIRVHG